MAFSKFPHFQKFTVSDIPLYITYYKRLTDAYCDFSLDDLFIWFNYYNNLEICTLNDNIVMRFSNVIDSGKLYYTLMGELKINNTITELMHFIKGQGATPQVHYIPELVAMHIAKLGRTNLTIEEDIDNREYIYDVDRLVKLAGRPYENLRRRVHYFQQHNTNISIHKFDLKKAADRRLINAATTAWVNTKEGQRNDPDMLEVEVIHKHLELARHLSVYAYGILCDDTLVNINIFQVPPQKGWLILNHIKCDYQYKDVFGYAFYSLFTVAREMGLKWVNFEQDLGISGLRTVKTLFHPDRLLHRYTVSLLPDDINQ